LKLSAKAFGLGLPGAMQCNPPPVCRHRRRTAFEVSSVPLPETIVSGRPRRRMMASGSRTTRRPDSGVDDQRQAFPRAVVDDRQ